MTEQLNMCTCIHVLLGRHARGADAMDTGPIFLLTLQCSNGENEQIKNCLRLISTAYTHTGSYLSDEFHFSEDRAEARQGTDSVCEVPCKERHADSRKKSISLRRKYLNLVEARKTVALVFSSTSN